MTRELPPLPLSPPNAPPQDGTSSQKTFVHVPSSIEAEEAEEIGVEHLLRDVKSLSSGGALSSRVSDQLSSLRGLGTRLLEIKEYLEQVVEGQLPVNHQIVYNLQDVFNLLPNLDAAAAPREGEDGAGVKRPFTVATNDQLLVMYLSSLIRAVIALHDLVRLPSRGQPGIVCSDPCPPPRRRF
jgi:26S proteasome regulatory subunit N8